MQKIIISGPESTGKTELSKYLAAYFNTGWVPEYAREYMSRLNRSYVYEDLETIAQKQVGELQAAHKKAKKIIFFDTGLIITKIWFLEAFKRCPNWLDAEIKQHQPALYLLCYYDLSWQPDPLRENGSIERRTYLFNRYLEEIKKIGCKYQIIKGFKQERYKLAIQTIENTFLRDVGK